MGIEIYATIPILAKDFIERSLPEPLVFKHHINDGSTRPALILKWPEVCTTYVYEAGVTGYRRHFKPNLVYFEVFGINACADACGPLFSTLGQFLACKFVTEYGEVMTLERGVDSGDYDTEIHGEAIRVMEERPGSLTKRFGNADEE